MAAELPWAVLGPEFRRLAGGDKWVVARRTPRIVARYGADVVCLSPKRYAAIMRQAEDNLRRAALLIGL